MSVLVESNSAMTDTTLPFSMRGVSPSTTNFKFPYTRNGETRQTIAMRFETVRQEYIYIMQSNFVCSTYSPKYITYKYLALHPFFLPSLLRHLSLLIFSICFWWVDVLYFDVVKSMNLFLMNLSWVSYSNHLFSKDLINIQYVLPIAEQFFPYTYAFNPPRICLYVE